MIRILALAALALITATQLPVAQQASVVGTWKLVSYDTRTAAGVTSYPLGQDLAGLAIYLPNGRVSIQFMRRDRESRREIDDVAERANEHALLDKAHS